MIVRITEDDDLLFKDQMTEEQVKSLIEHAKKLKEYRASHDLVISKVCYRYGILPQDLKGKDRTQPLPEARSIVYYRLVNKLNYTLKTAGALFGQDHSSVSHCLKKAQDCYMLEYKSIFGDE